MAVVQTSLGSLRGNSTPSYREFLGIEYAQHPVGSLRFLPPRPIVEKWNYVRDATRKGIWCPQFVRFILTVLDNVTPELADKDGTRYGEECLNLSVFTPPEARIGNGKLPVLVW